MSWFRRKAAQCMKVCCKKGCRPAQLRSLKVFRTYILVNFTNRSRTHFQSQSLQIRQRMVQKLGKLHSRYKVQRMWSQQNHQLFMSKSTRSKRPMLKVVVLPARFPYLRQHILSTSYLQILQYLAFNLSCKIVRRTSNQF